MIAARRSLRAALLSVCVAAGYASAGGGPGRSVLYPVPTRTLRFAHAKHAKLGCGDCHASAARSVSANDSLLPSEAACRSCHRDDTRSSDRVKRVEKAAAARRCATCHGGYRGGAAPAQRITPPARLRFSHRIHAARRIGCKTCHRMDGKKGGRVMPKMATCMSCHRERNVTNRCVACHLSGKSGRLKTRFGSERLRPRGTLKSDAHTRLFARHHRSVARGNRSYCQSCHGPRDCVRCHAQQFKPMLIHRSDYITHHALDARLNKPKCSSCHRSQTFCLSCHLRSGVGEGSTRGGFRPSTGLSFHPPGFNSLQRGPGHHATAARRNISSCVSCHTEKTCIRCHGTRQLQRGGFSPHPANFGKSLRCRMLSRRNQRVCLKCHAPGDRKIDCR